MEFRRSVFGTATAVTLASGLVLGTALSSQACIQAKVNSVVQSFSGLKFLDGNTMAKASLGLFATGAVGSVAYAGYRRRSTLSKSQFKELGNQHI
jgi:hypothetical protein